MTSCDRCGEYGSDTNVAKRGAYGYTHLCDDCHNQLQPDGVD